MATAGHHLGWALKTDILEVREATSLNHSALQIVTAPQLGIFLAFLFGFLRLILSSVLWVCQTFLDLEFQAGECTDL